MYTIAMLTRGELKKEYDRMTDRHAHLLKTYQLVLIENVHLQDEIRYTQQLVELWKTKFEGTQTII